VTQPQSVNNIRHRLNFFSGNSSSQTHWCLSALYWAI